MEKWKNVIKKRPKEVMMKRKSSHILENHIYSCVSNDLEKGNLEIIDELVSIFKKFNK